MLSVKNFTQQISAAVIKKAQKLVVRELDETEGGHFVSYVDEGTETYDVKIVLSKEGNIVQSECDCKQKGFCVHRVAVLMSLDNDKKPAPQKAKSKKVSVAAQLLSNIEFEKLKDWVNEILEKNKDLEVAFVHHFSPPKIDYTYADIKKLTQDAVKAIVKNRKTIDQSELKKIIDLWANIHKPILAAYFADLQNETSFLMLHEVIVECFLFDNTLKISSNKIPKYVEDILTQTIEPLYNIVNEEAWQKAVGLYVKYIKDDGDFAVKLPYLKLLKKVTDLSNEPRKSVLIIMLIETFKQVRSQHYSYLDFYNQMMFELIKNTRFFEEYYDLCEPIIFKNEFNADLISHLIEYNKLDLAKEYCYQQIAKNYQDVYNISYLLFLKKILLIQQDDVNLIKLLELLIPLTFSFEDFKYRWERMPDNDERKKWRTKILTRARQLSPRNRDAAIFSFELLAFEGNYKKMIELIDFSILDVVAKYFEPMFLSDKEDLLKALIQKTSMFIVYEIDIKELEHQLQAVVALINRHYDKQVIELVIALQRKSYPGSRVLRALTNNLQID